MNRKPKPPVGQSCWSCLQRYLESPVGHSIGLLLLLSRRRHHRRRRHRRGRRRRRRRCRANLVTTPNAKANNN